MAEKRTQRRPDGRPKHSDALHRAFKYRNYRTREHAVAIAIVFAISACTGFFGFDGLRLAAVPVGKPGLDLTAAGNISTSSRYKLVGAVGESPGGNVVGKSARYTLYGGVIAATR
jgi:hypothetical protein